MNRQADMDEIRSQAAVLLHEVCVPGRTLVWGEGSLDASLAIVGEAPGAEEDRAGRPFVGQAGQLLDRELAAAGLMREQVYITNVVKCRPTRQLQGGRVANRPPSAEEIRRWHYTLTRELEIVSPGVILCLGAVAASTLIHPHFAMRAERGRWFAGPSNTQAMATYHPAYVLRTMGYGDEALEQFRGDLRAAAKVSLVSVHM